MNNKFFSTTRFLLGVVALCLICAGLSTNAQTVSGTMQGRITDTNGDAVPGATVIIKNIDTGQERTLTSSENGLFSAPV